MRPLTVIAPQFKRIRHDNRRIGSVVVTDVDTKSLAAFLRRHGWSLVRSTRKEVEVCVNTDADAERLEQQVWEWLDKWLDDLVRRTGMVY